LNLLITGLTEPCFFLNRFLTAAPHNTSLQAADGQELEFVIFGTPSISIEDERAKPRRG
jgi:hypothetical protein